jgi:mRNA interferase MazF
MKRGDVFWAELSPRSGSEQQGKRPVIVLSHDAFNEIPTWQSVIVIPCSTSGAQRRRGPTAVLLSAGTGGLSEDSVAVCHQITTLDRSKLTRKLGSLPGPALNAVADGLRAAVDLSF